MDRIRTDGGNPPDLSRDRRLFPGPDTRYLSDDDFDHMRKVGGYVHRHLKQGGPKDADKVEGSPWRLSLMNWGHDPLKDK